MKRLIIITFVTVLCLLFLADLFCLANEPYNYGKFWNSWSDRMRSIYIMGLKDGLQSQYNLFFNAITQFKIKEKDVFDKYLEDSEVVKIEEKRSSILWDFILFDDEAIRNVMTDLYKDPANTYVSFYNMSGIAYRKLKGESIELLLSEARKQAIR